MLCGRQQARHGALPTFLFGPRASVGIAKHLYLVPQLCLYRDSCSKQLDSDRLCLRDGALPPGAAQPRAQERARVGRSRVACIGVCTLAARAEPKPGFPGAKAQLR